ncbi:MAG: hypothetical protein GY810_22615 [Aureispira sp.]|nr:hypothetical protein [Aureispira sp.]
MNLEKLVAISGRSGIYRMAANRANGLIVEDLDSGKKFFVSGRLHQFTPLESISIYTTTEESTAELKTVFNNMLLKLDSHAIPTGKASSNEVRAYFEEILPEFDPHKVLTSDIKKLIKWFVFLNQRDLLSLIEETEEVVEASEEEE